VLVDCASMKFVAVFPTSCQSTAATVGVVEEVVRVVVVVVGVVVVVVVSSRGAVTFVRKSAMLKRWRDRSVMAAWQTVDFDPVKLTGVWSVSRDLFHRREKRFRKKR